MRDQTLFAYTRLGFESWVGRKIIDGPRKAFTIGFGASEQPIYAITERLLSKRKSAFECAYFLKASGNGLQQNSKR